MVIAIGIYTFFATMVVVEPPILNVAKWSALDITLTVYDGRLPVPEGSLDEGLLEIALIYVLMILALAALCVAGPPKALLLISTIGFAASSLAKFLGQYLSPSIRILRTHAAVTDEPWASVVDTAVDYAGSRGHLFCKDTGRTRRGEPG